MSANYLDAIRSFEGFTPQATWDYAQHTNGYGTRAKYAGEVIDKAEADRRFSSEIASARAIVERHAPDAAEGTKQALTSLTFNAGDKWTKSGLGDAIRTGDTTKARELFLQYTKAGGEVLPGLVKRRVAEAAWIGQPAGESAAASQAATPASTAGPVVAQSAPAVEMPSPFRASPVRSVDIDPVRLAAAEPVEQADAPAMTDADVEAELLSKIRSAVSGLPGEARMTQLLLASEFLGAPSAAKADETEQAGSGKGLAGA